MIKKIGFLKQICFVLAILSIAVLTSGCSLRSTTTTAPKKIVIWGFDDPDVWKPVIKEASKKVKGYDIQYVQRTYDANYENDSLNSILAGQGPDIWAIPSDSVYRHKDQLAPMPDTIAKTYNLDDNYVPAIKQTGYLDGKIYAISPSIDTLAIFYNSNMLSQIQTEYNTNRSLSAEQKKAANAALTASSFPTWTKLVETVNTITQRSGNTITRSGIALGTSNNVSRADDILYALMLQNETKMTSDAIDTATFNLPTDQNSAPGKSSLDFYRSFSDPNSPNYSWNSSMPNDVEAFANGQTAMMINFGSTTGYLAQKYPNFKYKKTSLPQLTLEPAKFVDYASFVAFTVPKISPNSSQSWGIIDTLMGAAADGYLSATGSASSRTKKNFVANLADRNTSNPGNVQAQTAKTWTKGRYPNEIDSIIMEAIGSVSGGAGDSQAALDLASTKATEYLRRTSW